MAELEQVRKMVEELIEKAGQGTVTESAVALEKATQLLKSLSEMEKSQAEIKKLKTDERKTRYDLDHASKQYRREGLQRYITLLTPVFTTLVLALTLVSQTYQFIKTERDKQDAAEDAQWSEAIKTVSQSGKLSPIAVTLNPFLKSKRYADAAKKTAVQVITNTHDQDFSDLFKEVFTPVDWGNLESVLQVDRTLGPRLGTLYGKSYRPETRENDLKLLSDDERQEYQYISGALPEICRAIVPLLKGPRPQGQGLDLRSVWFSNCDLSKTNLGGADISNIDLRFVDMSGADLSGVTSFGGMVIYGTAWWDADRISPELLDYLIQKWPYDPTLQYGTQYKSVPRQHYEEAVSRLRSVK